MSEDVMLAGMQARRCSELALGAMITVPAGYEVQLWQAGDFALAVARHRDGIKPALGLFIERGRPLGEWARLDDLMPFTDTPPDSPPGPAAS